MARPRSNSPESARRDSCRSCNESIQRWGRDLSVIKRSLKRSLLEDQFTCVGSRLAREFKKGRGFVHHLNSWVAHGSESTATKNSRNAKWTAAIHGGNPVRSPDGDSQHAHRRGGATLRVEVHVPPRLLDRTAQ